MIDGSVVTDKQVINDRLNKHFTTVATRLNNSECFKRNSDTDGPLEFISIPFNCEPLEIPFVTQSWVIKKLQELKINKATGSDYISPFHLTGEIISGSLQDIINKSIVTYIFPQIWKNAKITAMHKDGDAMVIDNYRSLSILCTASKLLEQHVSKCLYNHMEHNNLLTSAQSGFRPGYSCQTLLTRMVNNWKCEINNGYVVGCLVLDLRKAFDVLNHHILLCKLWNYGCSMETVNWFRSYLTNRTQAIHSGDNVSTILSNKHGSHRAQ